MDRGSRQGAFGRIGLVTALILLALTALALVGSQRLKRQPLVVDRIEFIGGAASPDSPTASVFSPNGDCRRDEMTIRFRTTRSDQATVEIVTPKGALVRTLADDRFLKRYREHAFIWRGTDGEGRPMPGGPYKVRVTLIGQDRILVLPRKVRLHRFPPLESACREQR